jgi:hypothetical protein
MTTRVFGLKAVGGVSRSTFSFHHGCSRDEGEGDDERGSCLCVYLNPIHVRQNQAATVEGLHRESDGKCSFVLV